jgi:hypothetical protein
MKENCLIIILIMNFALIVPTIAEQENLALGPYKVTFDMGIDNFDWDISGPTTSETLAGSADTSYEAIRSKSYPGYTLAIYITEYNFSALEGPGDQQFSKKTVDYALRNLGCTDIAVKGRTIDGHNAAIGLGIDEMGQDIYIVDWWMDNATVNIYSYYPWDEGTLALFNTIHVEKINATV